MAMEASRGLFIIGENNLQQGSRSIF
jgi:hypothetical protein